jgi:hypothetical protein
MELKVLWFLAFDSLYVTSVKQTSSEFLSASQATRQSPRKNTYLAPQLPVPFADD